MGTSFMGECSYLPCAHAAVTAHTLFRLFGRVYVHLKNAQALWRPYVTVVFSLVCRTVEGVSFQPRDLPIGPVNFQLGQGKLIDGLDTALQGTMPGAKLRILVPSNVGYLSEALEPSPPGFAAKRQLINHKNEPFLFEVQVRKVIKG